MSVSLSPLLYLPCWSMLPHILFLALCIYYMSACVWVSVCIHATTDYRLVVCYMRVYRVLKFFGAPCVFLDWKHGNSIVSHCPCHDFSFPFSLSRPFPHNTHTHRNLFESAITSSCMRVALIVYHIKPYHNWLYSVCDMQDILWLKWLRKILYISMIIIKWNRNCTPKKQKRNEKKPAQQSFIQMLPKSYATYNRNEISFPGIRLPMEREKEKKRGLLNLPHAKNALSL